MDDDSDSDAWEIMKSLKSLCLSTPLDGPGPGPVEDRTNACCANPIYTSDEGQNFCKNCNTIGGGIIETGAEWRYYGSEDARDEDPNRCGLPTNDLLPKSSLGSVIGGSRGESKGVRQIRMYQMWNSMPYWERTLYGHFDKVTHSIANYNIPSKVLDDAKVLIKRVSEKKISRGDNKEGVIASCIYYACLINNTPRSTKEVAKMFHIDQNVLTKGNARFQNLLKLNVKCSTAEDFIARFASQLDMDYEDIQKCKAMAKKLDDMDIVSENSPTSVAAGAIFFYCSNNAISLTKAQIAEACGVSAVTITKCYKRLQKWKEYLA